MSAAGTSLADLAHQAYDQVAYVTGYGQGQGEGEGSMKEEDETQSHQQQPPADGPGNHPNDPHAPTFNQQNQEKHSNYNSNASQQQSKQQSNKDRQQRKNDDQQNSSTDNDPSQDQSELKTKGQDSITRALGSEGPVSQYVDNEEDIDVGTALGKRSMGKKLDNVTKEFSSGATVGEPIFNSEGGRGSKKSKKEEEELKSKEREEINRKNKRKEEGIDQDEFDEHPAERGPIWASRPNDEQRQKIKELKFKRDQNAKGFAIGQSEESREKEIEKELEGKKGESGGSRFGSAKPSLKLFLGGGGSHNGEKEKEKEKEKNSSTLNGRPSPQSNWSHNDRSMRGAFDDFKKEEEKETDSKSNHLGPLDPSNQKTESSTPASSSTLQPPPSALNQSQGEGSNSNSKSGGLSLPTIKPHRSESNHSNQPSTPTGKMKAISKLMVGGGRSNSSTPSAVVNEDGEDGNEDGNGQSNDSQESPQQPQSAATARWSALKQRIRESSAKKKQTAEAKNRASGVDLTRELQSGILPVLLLKMSIERDEQKHRRIPVLLNHLKLRVTDSVNPLSNTHAIFRIELEYGDGLVKWVVYRELRDFINLHAHYRAAALRGYLGRPVGVTEGDVGLPSFPKTSLPYFNQLQRQGKTKNGGDPKAEFASAQRESLENYIIELIRKTMFRPEANRLCKFFEISALSVSLASRGGYQGKQGYLKILSKSSRKKDQKGVLTPVSWLQSREPKWFIVRESYLVIVSEPDTLQIHDVFLIDGDFGIERPKRLYKQTLNLAHKITNDDESEESDDDENHDDAEDSDADETAVGGSDSHRNSTLKDKGKSRFSTINTKSPQSGGIGESSSKHRRTQSEGKGKGKAAAAQQDNTALLTEGAFNKHTQDKAAAAAGKKKGSDDRNTSSHTFYIKNAERRLKLVAKNERQMEQFISSMERVAARSIFCGSNRFGSFAPIRLNCSAQWLVDGRDYFWNVSKALEMARDRIFIHDWWLSPEVYLRRPGQPKYRLDNILKRKAEQGVKIFVIVYNEVSNNFTPTDSNYTKQRLTGLHRNIYVQRSPSHFQTGTFYWAHHEKLCVIDETVAFMGGLDLCFGRWDTPAHVLVDDAEIVQPGEFNASKLGSDPALLGPSRDGAEAHIWPGQDYANERVMEWHTLSKPEQDLFSRTKFPRMPWHDVGLQLVGQPARDLCRHFTQRWNYLLRIKNHSRVMPFLVPPPDFTPQELTKYNITGTCEAQICRSAGPWSLGTSSRVEHSIQNAYLKAIQMSDHFVYIENQFFVTSTVVEGNVIENQIGEALVSRIIRAHREGTDWRAVIVIPLIPGFPMPIDHPDASSVRIIVECQMASICRGEHSIFGKLRREGIDPNDYISFFSLRNWGKLRGGQLTTEQVYIHGKIMIVDDRLVIIGSANINERSQRGDRDSELACVVRDTDMIDSKMAGKPYKVGNFAHTLRVKLMREHLGVDVDAIEEQEASMDMMSREPERMLDEDDHWDPDNEQDHTNQNGEAFKNHTILKTSKRAGAMSHQFGGGFSEMVSGAGTAFKEKKEHLFGDDTTREVDDEERAEIEKNIITPEERVGKIIDGKIQNENGKGKEDGDEEIVPTMEEIIVSQERPIAASAERTEEDRSKNFASKAVPRVDPSHGKGSIDVSDASGLPRKLQRGQDGNTFSVGAEDRHQVNSDQNEQQDSSSSSNQQRKKTNDEPRFSLSHSSDNSKNETSAAAAAPKDSEDHRRRAGSKVSTNPWAPPTNAPDIDPYDFEDPISDHFFKDVWMASAVHNTQIFRKVFKCVPDDTVTTWSEYKAFQAWSNRLAKSGNTQGAKEGSNESEAEPKAETSTDQTRPTEGGANSVTEASTTASTLDGKSNPSSNHRQSASTTAPHPGATKEKDYPKNIPKPPAVEDSFSPRELEQMENLLDETRGSLVVHPLRFLEAEDRANNLVFSMDWIGPFQVYC